MNLRGKIAAALLLLVMASMYAHGQEKEVDKLKRIEAAKEGERQRAVRSTLDSAVLLTDGGQYEAADKKYMYVLQNLKPLPSDLTFHFGRNSYHLGKFGQSVDWLNKYIQLKGATGEFSEEAVDWLKKAEAELLKQQKQQSAAAAEILSRNYDIDCGPTGKVTCPVCKGSTVVIRKTYLGESYKTCTSCAKRGYVTCDEFNRLLRGEPNTNR